MDSLKKIISAKYTSRSILARQIAAGLVVEFANELVKELWGKKGQGLIKVKHLRNKLLTVHCENSIAAQEMKFKQYKFMKLLNKKFDDQTVKKIKIIQIGQEENYQLT